jgi:N-acetylneuraminic acid mutarotase
MGRKNNSGSSKKKKANKPTSPAARTGHLMASDGRTVVVTGGYSDKSTGFMDIWSYTCGSASTEGGEWMCLHETGGSGASPSPLPRSMAAGCLLDGCLYLFGGMQQEGSQMLVYNDLWQFNLASRQWCVCALFVCLCAYVTLYN